VLGTQRAEPVKAGLRTLASLLAAAEEEEARLQAIAAEKERVAAEEADRVRAAQLEELRLAAAAASAEARRKEADEEERRARQAEEAERSVHLVAAADAHDARVSALEALAPAADAVRARLNLYAAGRSVASQLALLRTLPSVKASGEEIAWFAEGVQAAQAACDATARQLAQLRDTGRRAVEAGAAAWDGRDLAAEESAELVRRVAAAPRTQGPLIQKSLTHSCRRRSAPNTCASAPPPPCWWTVAAAGR
jgi:hypothetical protein